MDPSTDRSRVDEDIVSEWYMNKSFKSMTVKVLHSASGGICRTRIMGDLLRGHNSLHQAQPICRVSTPTNSSNIMNATKSECGSSFDDHALKPVTQAEDDDFGKMTLKEMHQLLRKSAQKVVRKRRSALSGSLALPEAGSILGNNASVGTLCSTSFPIHSRGLELQLDSSTSSSAESGDDASPWGVATSCLKPDRKMLKSEVPLAENYGQETITKKRKSRTECLISKGAIALEDDECTLQMWQAYRRQLCGGKRFGGHEAQQACDMDEKIPCEPLLPSAAAVGAEVCSMNLALDGTDQHEPLNPAPECLSSEDAFLDNNDNPGSSTVCSPFVCEVLEENSSLNSSDVAIVVNDSSNDGIHLKAGSTELTEFTIKGDGAGHSSVTCEKSGVSQKTDTGRNSLSTRVSPWTLRPCKVYAASSSLLSITAKSHKIRQVPKSTFEKVEGSDVNAASFFGQSPAIKEQCTMAGSGTNAHATGIGSTRQTPQVITKAAFEPLDHERVSSSQRVTINEFLPVHQSEYSSSSAAEPETGLEIVEERNQNMGAACQLSIDEISGSPISLLSTERPCAEEQELEQLKPAKIPCKRKAISPLSREKLLQASKFGERERTFCEVDKRGLKKLPRAFKGFIGRDASNLERTDDCVKARNTVVVEWSSPEKLLHSDEALPGSPCHNRKKFMPSRIFLPKSHLRSSHGDSVTATTLASSPSFPSPSCVQRLSLELNSSPSPPQLNQKLNNAKSPINLSPSIPTKGILRSSPPTCPGACKCEECTSLRARAERAAEFSQRQMHDIEGLAVRLLKELNTMRCVVEESLIQRSAPTVDSPQLALSSEQVRRAANNALETEKMAKSWLVRMARDCNRYCKIMRMQERKLTFADESGGQLCHIKVFHSQHRGMQSEPMLLNAVEENTATSSGKEGSCPSDPSIDLASEKRSCLDSYILS